MSSFIKHGFFFLLAPHYISLLIKTNAKITSVWFEKNKQPFSSWDKTMLIAQKMATAALSTYNYICHSLQWTTLISHSYTEIARLIINTKHTSKERCWYSENCITNRLLTDWFTDWLSYGRTDGLTNWLTDGQADGRTDGLTDGRTDWRVAGRTGWTNEFVA